MPVENVLEEANRLIYGDRVNDYAHPMIDFTALGRHWGAILTREFKHHVDDIDPRIVGLMLVAVKVNREAGKHKRDNIVDMAGYAGTVARVVEKQQAAAMSVEGERCAKCEAVLDTRSCPKRCANCGWVSEC